MVLTDIQSRKARRKEERRRAKKKRRVVHREQHHHDDAVGPSSLVVEPITIVQKKKKKKIPNEQKQRRRCSKKETNQKDQGRQHAFSKDKDDAPPDNKHNNNNNDDDDPYGHLDPDLAAAMRKDDAEIAELKVKLGLTNKNDPKEARKRLHREYAKLEGYGDDFGDFLDDLDNLDDRIFSKPDYYGHRRHDVDDMDDYNNTDKDEFNNEFSSSSDDGEEIVPMKHPTEDLEEEDSSFDDAIEDVENKDEDGEEEGVAMICNEKGSDYSGSDYSSDEEDGSDTQSISKNSDGEKQIETGDTYQPIEGEDIYGHKTDALTSDQSTTNRYVPPHLRTKKQQVEDEADRRSEKLRLLQRSLNNVLNRLSEDSLISVSKSISKLYPSYPKSHVNECLWENVRNACVSRTTLMTGLIPVYVACMAAVHFSTGVQVQLGGCVLEKVVAELWRELESARQNKDQECSSAATDDDKDAEVVNNKEASNLVLILCYLYNYHVVHCTFLYDVIRQLIHHFSELDVEILLLILSHCGYSLRSDDPLALKEIVLLVQDRALLEAQQKEEKSSFPSRVQYMISAIVDLKNNKKRKQDIALGEKTAKLRKLLGRIKSTLASNGGVVRTSDTNLRITLEDVLNAETKGRWWKVGASWVGNQFKHRNDEDDSGGSDRGQSLSTKNNVLDADDDELLQLASKYRMNTDTRRSIFCIIMGSADCDDAFEKLVRAGMLKNRTERDTVRVLMECCGNEKTHNPFYSHLASRLCDYQPHQCKFTFQLAFWDIFKQFDTIKIRKAANLAKLLFHLVAVHHSLKLNILKVIDMSRPDDGMMPEAAMIFLTVFFSSIFDTFDDPMQVKQLFDSGIPPTGHHDGRVPTENDFMNDPSEQHIADDEGLRESLSVFFLQTLRSSPKNKKKSKFRANFKAAVKACETDVLDFP